MVFGSHLIKPALYYEEVCRTHRGTVGSLMPMVNWARSMAHLASAVYPIKFGTLYTKFRKDIRRLCVFYFKSVQSFVKRCAI